jgi:hypothetical protein
MIAIGRDEDLRLVAKPSESDGMDQAVAIALKNVTGPARPRIAFRVKTAAGSLGMCGDRRK